MQPFLSVLRNSSTAISTSGQALSSTSTARPLLLSARHPGSYRYTLDSNNPSPVDSFKMSESISTPFPSYASLLLAQAHYNSVLANLTTAESATRKRTKTINKALSKIAALAVTAGHQEFATTLAPLPKIQSKLSSNETITSASCGNDILDLVSPDQGENAVKIKLLTSIEIPNTARKEAEVALPRAEIQALEDAQLTDLQKGLISTKTEKAELEGRLRADKEVIKKADEVSVVICKIETQIGIVEREIKARAGLEDAMVPTQAKSEDESDDEWALASDEELDLDSGEDEREGEDADETGSSWNSAVEREMSGGQILPRRDEVEDLVGVLDETRL